MFSTSAPAQCDVVVIGAGIGGLTAATLLSKAGMKVCVVEMASRPGGYVAGFDREGFHFETAIHWLNQCGPTGFVRRVFNLIAPGSPLTVPNKRIRRLKSESYDYLLTDNPDTMRDAIVSQCPEEKEAIWKFFRLSRETAKAFTKMTSLCRSRETMSLLEKAKFFITANRAALPLIRYLPYSAERGINLFFPSLCLKKLFISEKRLLSCLVPIGWAYENDYQLPPARGSRAFAEWLCSLLKIWNATVLYNSRVVKVLVENGTASGVTCVREGRHCDIRAKYVIAACDVESLYEKMLTEGAVGKRTIRKIRNAERYTSCVTVSIGLDCSPADFGLDEEHILLKRDAVMPQGQAAEAPDKVEISIIAPSVRDPSLAPEGRGTVTIYAPCSIQYGNFWKTERGKAQEFVRGEAYRSFKKEYADTLLRRVEETVVCGLRNHIQIMDIATPVTYQRYTGNRDGAIMGFRPTFSNIRNGVAHHITPVKNLFVGSQWAELGGGVPMAVKAGTNSALLILKREVPEVFTLLCDVIDGRVSPGEVSLPILRTVQENR